MAHQENLLAVLRNGDNIIQPRDEATIENAIYALDVTSALVSYLLRNYPDDHWDDSTRGLLAEASTLLHGEMVVWAEGEDDDTA